MSEAKEHVASAIARAQEELEEALAKLETIPAFDAGSVAFAAHAGVYGFTADCGARRFDAQTLE